MLEETVADITNPKGCYILLLGETVNVEVKKQCDFLVGYWSTAEDHITLQLFPHTFFDHLQELVFDVIKSSHISLDRFTHQPLNRWSKYEYWPILKA